MHAAAALLGPPAFLDGWPMFALAALLAALAAHAHLHAARCRREARRLRARLHAVEATAQTVRKEMEVQVRLRTQALQSRNDDLLRQRRALVMANLRLSRLASQDALTGLANRRRFDHALAQQLRRARQRQHALSLIFLDLDGFKRFNDMHGHGRGDQVLRQVAAALQDTCQRHDALVARHGGEEFAVLLPGLDARHARTYAERLRRKVWQLGIASHCPHTQQAERVTISAGVITATPALLARTAQPPAKLAAALLKAADQALYGAKSQGRNRIVIATGWANESCTEAPRIAQRMELAS